eukprot:522053_1
MSTNRLFHIQVRHFGTRYRKNKVRTGKFGPRWFFKGRGCLCLGSKDASGKYRMGVSSSGKKKDLDKLLDVKFPNLDEFRLKPYVAWQDDR